ncbi:dTDP-4-dehydrorhamnose 3,5-epimerase [Sphingomonas sabuli]|uniref:dTDP-4-dehydrorhamnose 3,5-epimerase n=1 Tax=Sphingomonas sabuli TaxID=2764186 RepID=A0A7G9L5A8_9SPHN|nr:dTDP-4-dehydrorhamnose 3,5-epimerase [Sphingomonas sabuli]QNM83807.1 dTDP-4-dehydrorhamnose 3,5-epimerase [Sphingomonas sabuli]
MEFKTFEIDGPLEIRPRKIEDERGYFSEIFRLADFAERTGPVEFVQDNQSLSVKTGTIRGIHFQSHPKPQGKLVRCLAGSLLDVAVDLRTGSPTFGRWVSAKLTPEENNQLWVPVGFGHAFCSLEPDTVIGYRCTGYYSPENDKGVAWDDPDIAIAWPDVADAGTLSAKDRQQPSLADLPEYFTMEDQ